MTGLAFKITTKLNIFREKNFSEKIKERNNNQESLTSLSNVI